MSLASRVAIVTGAASGLGRATAARIVRERGAVVLLDLPTSKGQEVASELGDRAAFAPADVTNEEQVRNACARRWAAGSAGAPRAACPARACRSHQIVACGLTAAPPSPRAQVNAALSLAESKFGRVNAVINCAGIAPPSRVVGRKGPHPLDLFAKVLHVNTVGTFNVSRLAASRMVENEADAQGERGCIINTARCARACSFAPARVA